MSERIEDADPVVPYRVAYVGDLIQRIDHLTATLREVEAERDRLRGACEVAKGHALDVSVTALTVVEECDLEVTDRCVKSLLDQVRMMISALANTAHVATPKEA